MVWHRVKFIAWVRVLPQTIFTIGEEHMFLNQSRFIPFLDYLSSFPHTQTQQHVNLPLTATYFCVDRQSVELWKKRQAEVSQGTVKSVCCNSESNIANPNAQIQRNNAMPIKSHFCRLLTRYKIHNLRIRNTLLSSQPNRKLQRKGIAWTYTSQTPHPFPSHLGTYRS